MDETIDDCNNNDEDVMSLEAADVLREWTEIWHQLYIDQDQSKFNQLKVLSSNFLFWILSKIPRIAKSLTAT